MLIKWEAVWQVIDLKMSVSGLSQLLNLVGRVIVADDLVRETLVVHPPEVVVVRGDHHRGGRLGTEDPTDNASTGYSCEGGDLVLLGSYVSCLFKRKVAIFLIH